MGPDIELLPSEESPNPKKSRSNPRKSGADLDEKPTGVNLDEKSIVINVDEETFVINVDEELVVINLNEDDSDSNEGGSDPNEGGSDPNEGGPNNEGGTGPNEGGPNPSGDDSDPPGKKPDKGKAKATTPQYSEEEARELARQQAIEQARWEHDVDYYGNEIDWARLNSLKDLLDESKTGESSKKGAELFNQGEESPNITEYNPEEENREESTPDINTYNWARGYRKEAVRTYNDIIGKLTDDDTINPYDKSKLVEESVRLRGVLDEYATYIERLKHFLDLPSEEEVYDSQEFSSDQEYSDDNLSGYEGEDSNTEEKKPRPLGEENSSEDESRPSKRPRK